MTHEPSCSDFAQQASLFAVGAMTDPERTAFEAHLDTCESCRQEVRRASSVLSDLVLAVPPITPSAGARDELLRRVKETTPNASPLQPQLMPTAGSMGADILQTVRANDANWESTAVSGVQIRMLSIDRERDQFSALVRMAAGASYPRHVHGGPEHCLVLEGDLRVGDEVLHPGDYQLAPAGSPHGVQSTEAGCLLFIVSSLHDSF